MKFCFLFVLVLFPLGESYRVFAHDPGEKTEESSARHLLLQTFARVDSIRTLQFHLVNTERIGGKLLKGEQKVWMQVSPFRCYLYMIEPQKGAELLYTGENKNGEAIYNPKGFPYMQMNLDPLGALMRRNNHHTIFELGFTYLTGILRSWINSGEVTVSFSGESQVDGKTCQVVVVVARKFEWQNYTVREGEDLVRIARRKKLNEYMILEANPEVAGYNDVEAGQVIKIPGAYAKWVKLSIDKETMLPVEQKIFDEKGLFEKYTFLQLRVNPNIPAFTFSEKNLGKIR